MNTLALAEVAYGILVGNGVIVDISGAADNGHET